MLREELVTGNRFSLFVCGEGEIDRCAPFDLTLGPNTPTVAANYSLHQCEANSRPLELAVAVEPLEGLEQSVHIPIVKSCAVVPHEEYTLDPLGPASNLDSRLFMMRGELPGVREEVRECSSEESSVSPDAEMGCDHEIDLPVWSTLIQFVPDLRRKGAQIYRLEPNGGPSEGGQDRPRCVTRSPGNDLRTGLPGMLVRIPTQT